MKTSLQISNHQVLEPKEILRQRIGQHGSQYLVKWNLLFQNTRSASQSDTSSNTDGKNDKSILIWMTEEEVQVVCSELLGAGFGSKSRKLDEEGHKQESEGTDERDSEDFEDMHEDVRKLVIRARKQMRRTGSKDEHPIKNISYTLKILSTYASLGSLASVFRQTGALDLILELLWSKEVETRRHAGRMLRALASHDAGSRAYVLLSLIQDRPGHTTCGDDNADFENRNTVMEMFAETSSGEEANAFSLDFIQLPQVPGKALFRLMKCYLKVTSLLDMDSQLGDVGKTSSSVDAEKESPTAKSTAVSSSCHKFEVAIAIADLIFELSEVMGWNNKTLNADNDTMEKIIQEKDESKDIKRKPVGVVDNYLKEFASFVAKTNENLPRHHVFRDFNMGMFCNDFEPHPFPIERRRSLREGLLMFADSGTSTRSSLNKAGDSADALKGDSEMTPTSSRCIFSSKRKETVDAKLLSDLIKDSIPTASFAYKTASMFPTVQQYVNYLKSILKVGWKVRMMTDDDLVREGDEGVVRKFKDNDEPGGMVEVYWSRLSETVCIKPQNIEIIGCPKSDKTGIHPDVPEYLQNPQSSKLWPRLTSNNITKVSSHPYSSGLGMSYQALLQGPSTSVNCTKSLMTQRQWWEVLFFIGKLPQMTAENVVKEIYDDVENGKNTVSCAATDPLNLKLLQAVYLLWYKDIVEIEKMPDDLVLHKLCFKCRLLKVLYKLLYRDNCAVVHLNEQFPTFKYASSLIQRIVDQNLNAENLFRKSILCSRFLKPKEQKKKVKAEHTEKKEPKASESKEKDEKQNNASDEKQAQDLVTETAKETTDVAASAKTQNTVDAESETDNQDEPKKEVSDSCAKAAEDFECDADDESKKLRQKIGLYLSYLCKQKTTFLDASKTRLNKLIEFAKDLPKKLSDFLRSNTPPEAILDHMVTGLCSSDEELLVMMVFLHVILLRYQTSGFSNQELNRIIFHLQNVPVKSDRDICLAWMECIRIMLAMANANPSSMRGTELVVATSGCLARLFQIIKLFSKCKDTTVKAVQCLNLATRAVKTYTSPHSGTPQSGEMRIIQEIIASIASASPVLSFSESLTSKRDQDSELAAFISSLDMILDCLEKTVREDGKKDCVRWQDTENNSEVGILYEGLCVCSMLVTGHKDLVSQVHETLSPLLNRGLKLCPMTSPLHDLMINIQGKLCDFTPEDSNFTILDIDKIKETKSSFSVEEKETKSSQSVSDKLEGAMEELLDPKNFPKLISSPNRLLDFLQAVLDDDSLMHYPQVEKIVNTLFPSIFFPHMNQKMSVEQLSRCVDIIQRVTIEPRQTLRPSGSGGSLSHILEERHRSQAISALLQLVDSLSSSVLRANLESTNSSSLKEVITKAVSLLQRLVDLDRDSAVIMCGLDAKQSLQKAIEKHESIPQASELIDCLQGYEKYKTLHSKLLVVVLGGTIGVALRCLEDSRRMQERLEIPLLSGLFDSLCQGSDFDLKEDKCWERIEVSSNHRQSSKLTDGNPKTYWESNGSSGSHWINIYMKKGVFVRKMTLFISPEDSSYMPARFVIMGGTRPSDISHTISQVNVSSTDSQLVVVENEKRYWPIIRISIRRCQQGGIDTRIRGFEIIGPKPSFWPVLHQQLYVRTSLAYCVKAWVWISSCLKENKDKLGLMEHGLLNLPSKIIQAIQHEQEFADMFLPTDESALVLGQAFRHAVVNPLVTAILEIEQGKSLSLEDVIESHGDSSVYDPRSNCLMYKLLSMYIDESERLIEPDSYSNDFDRIQQALFTSRLRSLTRLLVDLNPGSSVSNKQMHSSVSSKDWNQRVQTKSNKHMDSARSTRGKPSAVPSVHSLNHGSPSTSKLQDFPPNDQIDDDSYDAALTPGLTPLASLWCAIITERFYSFLVRKLRSQQQFSFSLSDHESSCPEIQFCKDLVKEYEHTRTCTTELFGSSVEFLMEYIKGISAAVGSLDGYCTITLSKNLAIALHRMMVDYNRRGPFGYIDRDPFYKTDEFIDKLSEFFCLANNLDWAYGFEQFYCNLLALRILVYNLTWIEREKQLCDRLRPCFPDSRPCEMLKDVMQSQTLWRGFVSHKMEMVDTLVQLENCQIPLQKRQALLAMVDEDSKNFRLLRKGLSVSVLSPVSWRLRAIRRNAVPDILRQLNSSLFPFLRDYERFFQCAYHNSVAPKNSSSRPLHWTGEGWAEMVDTVSGVTMQVTTPQMLLLLHFVYVKHGKKIIDREVDITDWKLVFPHHWKSALNSLVREKFVKEIDENKIVLNADAFVQEKSNDEFVAVRKGVLCRLFPMDMENTILKSSHHLELLTERRQNLIECAIIQLVKKKTCGVDSLVHEAVKYCLGDNSVTLPESNANSSLKGADTNIGWNLPWSHRFFPSASEVHARIKSLIDRGYIRRDSERPHIVEYMPDPQPLRSRSSTLSTLKKDESRSDNTKDTDDKAEAESLPSQSTAACNTVSSDKAEEDKISIVESTITKDNVPQTTEQTSSSSIGLLPNSVTDEIDPYPTTLDVFSDLINEDTTTHESTETYKRTKASFCIMNNLEVWQLKLGFCELMIQKQEYTCQSLTIQKIILVIKKAINTLSKVLHCRKPAAEALLLQLDWSVEDIVEHYMNDRANTLSSIGVISEQEDEEKQDEEVKNNNEDERDVETADQSEGCPICTGEMKPKESLALQCNHRCCLSCWRCYLYQKLDENQAITVKCPVTKCDARPTLTTFRKVFAKDKHAIQKYCTALVRSYVESDRSLTWCHCPLGCETVIRKGSSGNNTGTCSICGWQTCFDCSYVEAHYPASCGHMSQWMEDGGYYEGMGEDARSKHLARIIAKRCPNCQANIEKEDGCLHMKCLKCSHDFCWRCLKPWRPTHRDYYKCTAKVSKLAHAGIRFQEHNKRCQYHHKAKELPLSVLKRLMTVDAELLSPIRLSHAIKACVLLIKIRKVLAYSNIFSYYSIDTDRMKTMDYYSQVLENGALLIQGKIEQLLLGHADINYAVNHMTISDMRGIDETFKEVTVRLKNLLTFSAQDMKLASSNEKVEIPAYGEGTLDNPPSSNAVILNARPAGMSDQDTDNEDMGPIRSGFGRDFPGHVLELEGAVDRLLGIGYGEDNPFGNYSNHDDNEDEEEDDDIDEYFSSSPDSFSEDSDSDDDDDDDENRGSEDTMDTDYANDEDSIFDPFMF